MMMKKDEWCKHWWNKFKCCCCWSHHTKQQQQQQYMCALKNMNIFCSYEKKGYSTNVDIFWLLFIWLWWFFTQKTKIFQAKTYGVFVVNENVNEKNISHLNGGGNICKNLHFFLHWLFQKKLMIFWCCCLSKRTEQQTNIHDIWYDSMMIMQQKICHNILSCSICCCCCYVKWVFPLLVSCLLAFVPFPYFVFQRKNL